MKNRRSTRNGPFRDNKVFVLKSQCETCIFRKDQLKAFSREGTVTKMIKGAIKDQSCIICHETLETKRAVCRGFYDRVSTLPLQLAKSFGILRFQKEVDPK